MAKSFKRSNLQIW